MLDKLIVIKDRLLSVFYVIIIEGDKMKSDLEDFNTIYETDNYIVFVPKRPHVSREDGEHLVIRPKKHYISRIDLPIPLAKEAMMLTMLIGEAMTNGLKKTGIEIGRLNIQDNGNWAYLRGEEFSFHIHIYGRVLNSNIQKYGEALYFPDPRTDFYDNFKPLNDNDIIEIKKEIEILKNKEKYKLSNW